MRYLYEAGVRKAGFCCICDGKSPLRKRAGTFFSAVGSAAKDNTKEGGLKIIFDW